MNNMWIRKPYGYTSLMTEPSSRSRKIRDLSTKMVVSFMGQIENGFYQVIYDSSVGWIEAQHLEEYLETLPKNCVDLTGLQTRDQYDAEQYIIWPENGVKQVNMCGPMSIAFHLNVPLEVVLIEWKARNLSFYQRIFGQGRATGTGEDDLVKLYNDLADLFELTDTRAQRLTIPYYTPGLLSPLTSVVSCRINPSTGRLNGGGIGHWIVPTKIMPERCYGLMQFYNPYHNRIEEGSWDECLASMRNPYGIVIGDL